MAAKGGHYYYVLVAGSPKHPRGLIGIFDTKTEAEDRRREERRGPTYIQRKWDASPRKKANPASAPRRRNHWLIPMAVGAGAMHLAHRAKLMNPSARVLGPGVQLVTALPALGAGARMVFRPRGSDIFGAEDDPGYYLDLGGLLKKLHGAESPSPTGQKKAESALQRLMHRASKQNPARSRWGYTFKKGDVVQDHRGATYRYVKLAKADDFSRAYGKQAVVSLGAGPIDMDNVSEIGLDDLRPAQKANPAMRTVGFSSRARAIARSGDYGVHDAKTEDRRYRKAVKYLEMGPGDGEGAGEFDPNWRDTWGLRGKSKKQVIDFVNREWRAGI